MVAEEHYQQAKNLINEDFSTAIESACESTADYCHRCKSENIQIFTKGKKSAFVVFMLLGFPLFFYQHGIKCNECGHFSKT